MKVLVPDNLGVEIVVPGVEVVTYPPLGELPDAGKDAAAIVVFETPPPLLQAYARQLLGLRLVQTLSAGPDAVLAAGFPPAAAIASGRGLHDLPVTEHAIGLLLAAARSLPAAGRAQLRHRWATELGGRQPFPDPGRFSTLIGARVAIWGFGSIGHTLADRLVAMGAEPIGVTRDGEEPGTVAVTAVDALLPTVDALVLLLPGTPQNRRIVDTDILRHLPPHAWLVNVGRGSTLDEAALVEALHRGELAGAALDVFETEPLPPSSPLWEQPNVIITPHAAGGRPIGAKELIEDNLGRLTRGERLRNLVHPPA
jgi:phosphoglycerate dehydrogenase-like enzyme